MKFFCALSKSTAIIMALFLTLNSLHLDTFVLSQVSFLESIINFPCAGEGCSCDLAGRELPNCRCNHERDKILKTPPKITSCCAKKEIIVEKEDKSNTARGVSMSNLPCEGVEYGFTHTSIKLFTLVKSKNYPIYIEIPNQYFPTDIKLSSAVYMLEDHVPI